MGVYIIDIHVYNVDVYGNEIVACKRKSVCRFEPAVALVAKPDWGSDSGRPDTHYRGNAIRPYSKWVESRRDAVILTGGTHGLPHLPGKRRKRREAVNQARPTWRLPGRPQGLASGLPRLFRPARIGGAMRRA